MKRNLTTFLLVLTSFVVTAQTLPSRSEILEAMECANDYFIAKYPDPGAPTFVKKYRPSNLWTRGVYFEGLSALMELEALTGGKKYDAYHKYVYDWGTAHKWTPRNGVTTRDADDYCCSQTYLDMYLITDQYGKAGTLKERIAPTIECMDNLIAINDKSRADWTWIDAIQMGLPVMAKLARVKYLEGDFTGAKYLEQGWSMYECSRNELAGGLYNKEEGLWWRDKDFVAPYKEPNGEDCYWSRGNG
ncbi:MAG: glycoside hydrolase family 88 protein, partial [Bacteroidaceae bacterium]|nr:glycoside hydrolase family 88 protein [Bacteroidaceae bacterium]